jgi:hypothetical protein
MALFGISVLCLANQLTLGGTAGLLIGNVFFFSAVLA